MNSPALKTVLALFLLMAGGCAGVAPVPGGTDLVNQSYYKSREEFLGKLALVKPGMTRAEVFKQLGRQEEDFTRLDRTAIVAALFGSNNVQFKDLDANEASKSFVQMLEGYQFEYESKNRIHGLSSPIRLQTNEAGFDYKLTLIFYQGNLLGWPILAGGVVNDSQSTTIFDYLNPGTAVDAAKTTIAP